MADRHSDEEEAVPLEDVEEEVVGALEGLVLGVAGVVDLIVVVGEVEEGVVVDLIVVLEVVEEEILAEEAEEEEILVIIVGAVIKEAMMVVVRVMETITVEVKEEAWETMSTILEVVTKMTLVGTKIHMDLGKVLLEQIKVDITVLLQVTEVSKVPMLLQITAMETMDIVVDKGGMEEITIHKVHNQGVEEVSEFLFSVI